MRMLASALRLDFVEDQLGGMSSRLILYLALISLTAIFAIFAFTLYAARVDVTESAEIASSNVAVAVGQQIARDIEMLDLSLQDLADGAGNAAAMGLPSALRRTILFDRAATIAGHGNLLYLDAGGRLVEQAGLDVVPPIDFSRSPFFSVHVGLPDVGLYVSQPFVSLVDGETSIALSRRIVRDGAFAGVAVATLKLSYVQDLFKTLDLGPNGSVTLVSGDGAILVRQPFVASAVGFRGVSAAVQAHLHRSTPGLFDMESMVDGVHRLFAYSPIGRSEMTVFVGQSFADIYAAWWRRAGLTGLAMLLLGNIILVLIAALQIALRHRQAAERALDRLARTDKLTGLANRRSFDETLEREWVLASGSRQPLALLMLDIDHFKAFNDLYGHQGGDAVLAAVGACIAQALEQPHHTAARYGGEEFVVLMPKTAPDEALRVAGRIERGVAALAQPHPRSQTGVVTLSCGVGVLTPNEQAPGDLLRVADEALYAAKHAGRNRVMLGQVRQAA